VALERATGASAQSRDLQPASTAIASTPPPVINTGIGPAPPNMVGVIGGTFVMGSSGTSQNSYEVPRHVTVSSFFMGRTEVTQREYEEIMGYNPSYSTGADLPVERVSWFDVVEFCNKKSLKEGLTPVYTITGRTPGTGYPITGATVTWNRNANGYRLPTEAEWEFACRAGTTTLYNTGNSISSRQANFSTNSGSKRVGSYPPNNWNLSDMHGNVAEWCWDMFGNYNVADLTDPAGASSGSTRVQRGGSWNVSGQQLRSAYRGNSPPVSQENNLGFRIARNVN
jgi:formylglycine-generating enzyme required for sulfatase activity